MSEDTDVAPQKLPRYSKNIPYNRKSSDKNVESFAIYNGGPGAGVIESMPHNMNQTNPIDRPGEDRSMAGNKSNTPHVSRSRAFRESFNSGGYSVFKDFDSNNTPMFEITPISAGDFTLSDDTTHRVPQNEGRKATLTETIANLGIDTIPASDASMRDNLSTVLNGYGFKPTPNNNEVADAPAVDLWYADAQQDTPGTSNSRQKQRARSEPAGPRKAMTLSEEFSENIMKSLRSPGTGPEIKAPDKSCSPLKFIEGSTIHDQPCRFSESVPVEKPNVYLHTLDSQVVSVSDGRQKPKGKRKRHKPRNTECYIPILTANTDNNMQKGSSPEKHNIFLGDDHVRSMSSPRGMKFNDSSVDKSTPQSPKKSSPKIDSIGTSPKNKPSPRNTASPKVKPQQDPGNITSSPKVAESGRGEGSPSSPKGRRDSSRSRSQDSPKGKSDSKSPPYNEKSCNLKIPQPCHRRSRLCGRCYRPSFQGNLFKNIATAVGCQLTCIATCNQRYHGFPGIQGLYTPEVELESLFNQQPYTVCEQFEEARTPSTMNEVRSAPRRHGTPAFFSNRRHSLDSFRYRGSKGSEKRQRGVSQQAQQRRMIVSASERRYQPYRSDYPIQDDRQLRFELKQTSQSSLTSVGDNYDSSQSTEPPDEHSLAESRHSESKFREHHREKEMFGSEIRMQRPGTESEKKSTGNVSPRSFVSEDDDESINSRKSGRSTERKSKHDVRQTRRSSEVSQRLDMIPRGQVSFQSKKLISSGSEDRLQTDSGESITASEKQFIDRTRQLLEDSFKGPHICSRRIPTSERVVEADDIHVSKNIQRQGVEASEQHIREDVREKRRSITPVDEFSLSERKPVTGRRTPIFESRRANRSQIRDKSREYVLEASRPPVVKERCKYVKDKTFGGDEHKDVYSVGDRMIDGGIGLFGDTRSEIQSSFNTNLQVYTTLCPGGNAPLNVEDCAQARSFSGKEDFKDNEKTSTFLVDWSTKPDSDRSLRPSNDSKRSDLLEPRIEDINSNIPPDSTAGGPYSDISRSNLAGRRSSSEVPHHDIFFIQTTPECYSHGRSGSGHLRLPDNRGSELEPRKPSQATTYERNKAGRRDDRALSKEESKPEVLKSTECEKKRTASDQEYSHIHGNIKDSHEFRSRQNPPSAEREIHSSFERRSHHDSVVEAVQRPVASTDSGGWRELNVERPVNGTSSKPPSVPPTDCSSEELAIASSVDGKDASARKLFCRSKEHHEDDVRATDKSPYPSKRQSGQGYRERSELRSMEEGCPERGSSSKRGRGQCTLKTVEYSCTQSADEVNSRRVTENQERSSIDSKHKVRHRRLKRDYDSAYDDDMDDLVSQEDVSTSISRQLPVDEALQENYYDQRSHEYENTRSLRERTKRNMHFGEVVERKCHSERLSARSSSFKYEASKRMEGKHSNLGNYPSADQKGRISGVGVKSSSSRSSHTINSREDENVRVREASVRDSSLVNMQGGKRGRGGREFMHKQTKPYSSADTRSITFEAGNESHDEEDSENTLPASPGDLESEYLDEETEDRARCGKHRTHRGGTTDSDMRKLHGRIPSGRQDSHDESHNSSSCRTTSLEAHWDKLRVIPSPTAKGKFVDTDKSVKKYLEFLASKSTVTVERESPSCEPFHSDSCMERRCVETRNTRNRHRNYCDCNSGVHQTDLHKAQQGYVPHQSQIRTKSPKFQYYKKKSPQKVEDNDDDDEEEKEKEGNDDDDDDDDDESEDDTVTNKTISRSNSARYGNRSRRCREGTIDLFEQIIIPEQPLQVDEYHHMHSFKNGVPFFCQSLKVTTEHPESRKHCAPQSELSKSAILPSLVDVHGLKDNFPPHMYAHAWKSHLSSHIDSLEISPVEKTKPGSSGRHSTMHLKSVLLHSGKEKIQIYSQRRTEMQPGTTTVRQTDKISRKAEFNAPKDAGSSFSSECPNIDFEPEAESVITSGNDTPKEDNRDDLVLSCNVLSWGGNKNFSSNAERDRNSSSGNGDSWYSEYAYRCGVIDTLRILDNDLAISTPSAEFIHPCQKMENTSESCKRHHEIEDHLTYIMQSFPSLALCKQNDETFEIIRQNSLRALVYAAKLSVDWPPANFYDKNTGNLENWIREVKDYSSSSNVSSLTETYSFDVQSESEKLRAAHTVASNKQKCHVKSKSLKCSIYHSPTSLPKVLFKDVRIDEENASSPDHFFGDMVQNSYSEQLEDDSVALTEHEGKTAERKGTEREHSETTTYLSDSDSHAYTEQGLNSDITPSADHSSHELESGDNNEHRNHCLCKKKKSSDPNDEEGIITKIAVKSPNTDMKNPDSCRVRLRKAQLSPIEEDRLRSAISRKLGSQQSFALIPVSFSNSLMSTVQGVCDRSKQSREKSPDLATSCVVTHGRNASDKDFQDIFDDICDTHLHSQQNTMAFYVVAVDKQRSVDEGMKNDVEMGGERSHVTSCTSDGDGKHKKYFIYTKEELINAVANSFWEKCDLVKPSELSQLQHLQTSVNSTPNHPDHGSVVNRKREAPTFQSSIQRIPQRMDTHNEELENKACAIKPTSPGDYQAARKDLTGVKNHNYLYHTSRDQYLAKEQTKQNSGKSQTLEKQVKCDSRNPTFKVLNSGATSPSYTMNTHERTKKSKDVTKDYSVNLINKYKHKLERSPATEIRDCGASELVSHQLTAQNKVTFSGCQSKEMNTLEYEPVLEKRHRIQANNCTKDAVSPSEVLYQNHPQNLSYNDLADNYKYSEREESKWLNSNDKICLQPANVNNKKSRPNSRISERRESCLKPTNNLAHENAATNKCSSSTSASTSTKLCRKSKSYSDLDVSKVPDIEHGDCEKEKKKRKIQHRTLSLLETLVDGQLIAFFNNALKKITSPKHTICLRIAKDGGKIKGAISKPDPHDSKKDCNSASSSEEDQCMTSPSAASATETMTEKSLTEESVVILSLPAESSNRRKRRIRRSPVMKKQNNDTLQEWVNNSTPEISRLKSKSDKHKEKYVLSAKRKKLVYKGRGRYRYKRRANLEVQSSESGNITNSANDGNESEASDIKYHSSPSRPRSEWTHGGRNKRLRKRRTPEADNHHSPSRRTTSGTASRSRHRRNSGKPVARSETRCRSSSRSLTGTRGKRIKTCSLDSKRKTRSKEKPSHRASSSAKSFKMRNEEKPVEFIAGKVCKDKEIIAPPMTKNMKTFATSGISRIARALNGCHLQERKIDHTYELCEEGRSRDPGPSKSEGRKHLIKRNHNDTPEKGEVRIPISDEDSLNGCEPFESSILTPIKEESHSHDHTSSDKSKSDFESFVSKCRTKLMGVTSETPRYIHEHSEGCYRRKANCTMSCSNFSCLGSSTSSDNRCSQDETYSCDSQRKYPQHRRQEWRCPYHESDYDYEIGDKIKRNIPRTREYSFSYFQYVVPYKSAFLRQQMQEFVQAEAPVCKKEDELLKTYATGSSRSQYINSARGTLTIPWAVRQANVNLNWRNPEEYRATSEADNPIHTRSVPGVRCTKTREPSVSMSQTRTLSSLYTPYRPGYPCNISPQMSDYADIPGLGVRSRHLVSGDQARCSKYSSNHWFHSGSADYHELVHRNWNESANNGSDGSSSGDISGNEEIDIGDCDQHGEYLQRGHMKGKIQAGEAAAGANDRVGVDKASKEPRIGPGKQNHYIKQNHNTSLADQHCLCRDHGCMSYDFIHQNYPVARVSNFAARNINGSGNMFGRGLNPSDDRLSAMQEHDADSDEEFNSATEELPHYSSSCRKRPKYGRKGQEIDDTCNHPESMSYYMGDGPSGQYDNFEDLPKEDLLINLSPVNADDEIIYCSHHQKNAACQRALPTEAAGQASAGGNKQGRNDCDIHGPAGLGHQLDKNLALAGRSCYGQGDILNKRVFTQWYVDEGEKAQQSQRRSLVSVAQAEKCSHRERWITPSQQCDSSGDDGEEEDDDDEDNDCEDEDDDGEDNEDDEEGGEDDEDDDDDDDEDDEDDDENEDDDDDEDDEDENPGTPEQNLCEDEINLPEKPRGLDHMKEKNAQNYHHEKPQDINESKIAGHRIVETEQLAKRPTRVRTLTHTKRYAASNKPGHQQSTGDHLAKPKPAGIHEKNMHIKPTSGNQHKFSLEQIKVPAIEKERVRFACDENGDWAEIGRGSYGCVYLGLLDGVVEVAIKDFYESSSWDLVIHEARMLMFLQDTGITPKFYGLRRRFDVSKQPSEYCIIMEYFGDGRTLFNVMSDKMVLAGDEWMDIVGQLVAGLRLIHRKNVLINDLKADNILIDLTGGRKIIRYIDVGMATYKQGLTFQLPQDQMSKYNFLAPEVREGSRTTTRSDIYSLGYMLEQMCRMADSTLGGLRKLVARCMEKNPARRPDVDDIVSQVHRFIASKASIMINSSSPREQFVLTNSV